MYKVSIITINLNNCEGLKKTVQSVFHQTSTQYEFIIIDGGSSDGSKEYIEENSCKISYWISEKDEGVYHAMNKGIVKAKSNYLLFLNSGDCFYDSEVISDFIQHDFTEDLVYGNTCMGSRQCIRRYPEVITFRFLFENTICHQSIFFKRTLFENYGFFNTNFKIVSDWLFYTIAIVQHKASTKYFDRVISNFDEDGLSSINLEKGNDEREKANNLHFNLYIKDYSDLKIAEQQLFEYRSSRLVQWIMKVQTSVFYRQLRKMGDIK